MTNDEYRSAIRELSDRLIDAQRPIRILDAIKWDADIQEAFHAAGGREQPRVDAEYYRRRPLGFDPVTTRHELQAIERDIVRRLGQLSPAGSIMRRMCREYQSVIRMLEARGTADFAIISQELYGSANDAFHAGDPTVADLAQLLADTLENIDRHMPGFDDEPRITGEEAVGILQERLNRAFGESRVVTVLVSDGIVADAAAGSDYLKLRRDARFSERDLKVLEVHEGWVHLGTTLNGLSQPVCTFLGKGPPSSTVTQEGLAVTAEIVSFVSHPARLRRTTNRIRAVHMAEQGATFLDVVRFFRDEGLSERDAYGLAVRVFRGSTPTLGPFTKDISYGKGVVLIFNFLHVIIRKGKLNRVPLLFCGKTTLEDMGTIAQLEQDGLIAPPKFIPPPFADLGGLTAWISYSNFLNRLNLKTIEADYANLL
jgi:uncharacterized protein (TIGR02421 family)